MTEFRPPVTHRPRNPFRRQAPERDIDVRGVPHAGQEHGVTDEARHPRCRRALIDLFRPTELQDLTVSHDGNIVGYGECLRLVVRHEDAGRSLRLEQGSHFRSQLAPQEGIERTERFIEQHDFRTGGEGPREGNALRLASGELRGAAIGECGKPDELEQVSHPVLARGAAGGPSTHAESERHVLGDREVREQCRVLWHPTDPALLGSEMDAVGRHHALVEPDLSGASAHESRNRAQEGGLAAAARSDDRDERTVWHVERDAAQHRICAVAHDDVAEREPTHDGIRSVRPRPAPDNRNAGTAATRMSAAA